MDLLSFSFLTLPSEAPDLCDDKLLARAEFQQVSCMLSVHDVNPCAWILDKATDATGDRICGDLRDTLHNAKHGACTNDASFADYIRIQREKVTAANVAMKPASIAREAGQMRATPDARA